MTMKKSECIMNRLLGSMRGTSPYVTRLDLARFGAALLEELEIAMAGANDEYETRGKIAKRYHISPATLSRLCEKHGVRTIRKTDVAYVRYNVGDVRRALTSD